MKRPERLRWIAGLLLVFAGIAAAQAQAPSPFRSRMAAWQKHEQSRLVRQPSRPALPPEAAPPSLSPLPGGEGPLPGGNIEPIPEMMPSPMPPSAGSGNAPRQRRPLNLGGNVVPQPGTTREYAPQGDYPGEVIDGGVMGGAITDDGYMDGGYMDGGYYGDGVCGPGGCGPYGNCCGPLRGLFGCGLFCDQCSPVGGCVDVDPCCGPSLWWMNVDFTFGWRRGKGYPPLVTGGPDGVLPDASILYKDGQATSQMQPGMRLDFGTWIDRCEIIGVGGRFWFLGKDSGRFHVDSDEQDVIARPFFDFDNEQNDALLVAFPGLRSGSLTVTSTNEVLGADAYARMLLMYTCHGRLDLIGGYQFARINDNLRIASNTEALLGDTSIATGTTFNIVDQFATRNEFHGGSIGMLWERNCCNWTLTTMSKVAFGNMRQTAVVDGSSTITVPGQTSTTTEGGLLTAPTNIGTQFRDEFCVVPELNLSLAYQIRPCLSLNVGYSFMYFSDVLRPGDIIDTKIDTDNDLATRPALIFNSSNFWVQGLNLGLHYNF